MGKINIDREVFRKCAATRNVYLLACDISEIELKRKGRDAIRGSQPDNDGTGFLLFSFKKDF